MTKQEKQQREQLLEFLHDAQWEENDFLTEIWSVALNSNDK